MIMKNKVIRQVQHIIMFFKSYVFLVKLSWFLYNSYENFTFRKRAFIGLKEFFSKNCIFM
jgi:hypothetical protein